nr:outer membrane beta-barrel protein [Bacteroidota bacterium]
NPDYSQLVMPVNVPYAYNLYSFVYFSTPLRPLGINIKIRSHEMWKRGINIINEEENINTNTTHSLKISLENRNKKKWGVNLGGAMSLTNSKFSIAESMNNVYYNTSYFADARYTPGSKWNFKIEGNVVNYNSKSFTESISIPILNASITYYFLKGEKASLSVRGYDLLNRSLHISQVTDGNFLVREESNMIGQYIMLLFKIKIGKQ